MVCFAIRVRIRALLSGCALVVSANSADAQYAIRGAGVPTNTDVSSVAALNESGAVLMRLGMTCVGASRKGARAVLYEG